MLATTSCNRDRERTGVAIFSSTPGESMLSGGHLLIAKVAFLENALSTGTSEKDTEISNIFFSLLTDLLPGAFV